MKLDYLHNNLIEEIRERFPQKAILANKLADILSIEKEAVYRRLRKEVPFTFEEVSIISQTFDISLDNLVKLDNKHSRSAFQLQLVNLMEPQEIDYYMMNEYIELYHSVINDKHSVATTSTNIIPETILIGFKALWSFYLFKWHYHYKNKRTTKTYSEVVAPQQVFDTNEELFNLAKGIGKSYHILDHLTFSYIINDIKFFNSIGLVNKEDVLILKKDLYNLLDYLEHIATTGVYEETGKKVFLYISDLNIDSNYFYLDTKNIKISMLNTFIVSSAASYDENTFNFMKNWINSVIRISNLITVTGEKQRIIFFNSQRQLVDEL
ncbi:plasmid maintenance system antidote protein VapI [Dysgonomonadaceae bacterium PH5-43]|nr:plasmid maintenance system antidote protein VapI [Dysgonomonadaceae bacterium PH5-43]